MSIMLSPGVRTRELDFSMYAGSVSTCIVGMVGGATKGPIGVPTYITNPTDFVRIFGDPSVSEGDYGTISALLFLQKGNALWYVREENGNAVQPHVTFSGVESESSKKVTLGVVDSELPNDGLVVGGLVEVVISSSLVGVDKTFTFTVLDGEGLEGLMGRIRDEIALDGHISEYYTVSGTGKDIDFIPVTIDGGVLSVEVDTDLVNISGIVLEELEVVVEDVLIVRHKDKGTYGQKYSARVVDVDGDLFTFVTYEGNVIRDSFRASIHEDSPKYIGNKLSEFFEFEVVLGGAHRLSNSDKKLLVGGDNGLPLAVEDVVGVGNRGLSSLSNPNTMDINILCAPGRSEVGVINKVLSICESRSDCFGIIDTPLGLTPVQAVDFHNGVLGGVDDPSAPLNTSFGAVYYPWVRVVNPSNSSPVWVPPSAVVLGVYAVNDQLGNPWFAPAGLSRGRLGNVLLTERDLTEGEMDLLYGNDNAINPLINYRRQGYVVWGQRTLQREDTALDRVNVRRLMLYVRKVIAASSAYLVFEQNDATTWGRWNNMVTSFLDTVKKGRGIEEFKVQMDSTTVTPSNVDRNEMPGKVLIKPTKTAEFVVIDFVLTSQGATFNS